MNSVIIFLTGLLVGAIVANIFGPKIIGTLHINTSNEEGMQLYLQLSEHPDDTAKRKYVTFKVSHK